MQLLTSAALMAAAVVGSDAVSTWTCATGPGVLSVDSGTLGYRYVLSDRTWLGDGDAGSDYAVHCGGKCYSYQAGTLLPVSREASASAFSVVFKMDEAPTECDWPVQMTFKCYANGDGALASPTLVFETSFPAGASGPLSTAAENQMSPAGYNSSFSPLSHFPSWDASNSSYLNSGVLSHIEWSGTFSWQELNRDVGLFPHTNKSYSPGNGQLRGYFGGQTGGPVVLHEAHWDSASGERPAALFVAPSSSFKHSIMALHDGGSGSGLRWVFGPQGQLTSIPAGWSTSVAYFASAQGINDAVYRGGQVLQQLYNKTASSSIQKPGSLVTNDPGCAYVSVWTDNGAFYCWDYFDSPMANQTWGVPSATNVIKAIHTQWQNGCLQDSREGSLNGRPCSPLKTIQLDPWFYHLGAQEALINWTADPRLFGTAGLLPLADAGINLSLYISFWNEAKQVQMPPYTFVDSTYFNGSWMPLPFSQVAANQSSAFHRMIVQRGLQWGMTAFETDFLDWLFMAMQPHQQSVDSFDTWMQGMDSSLVLSDNGSIIPFQFCMGLPSDVLNSLTLQTVTNYRASQDNDFHYAPATLWSIGVSSLLIGALGLRPYFDVTWTVPAYPLSQFNDTTYAGIAHNSVELSIVMATLSTGPVGIGDRIGSTNKTLLRATCRADGMLLKPSLPLAAMDLTFLEPPPLHLSMGIDNWNTSMMAMQAGSFIPEGGNESSNSTNPPFVTVVVVDAAQPVVIYPSDVYPDLTPFLGEFSYVAVPWSPGFAEMKKRCAGPSVQPCFLPFNASTPLVVQTGGPSPPPAGIAGEGFHPFELLSLTPVFSSSGFGLIGSLDKITRVSPQRYTTVEYLPQGLSVGVTGVQDETVSLVFVVPSTLASSGLSTFSLDIVIPADNAIVMVQCGVGGNDGNGSCSIAQ
jgi:hypothetical protein